MVYESVYHPCCLGELLRFVKPLFSHLKMRMTKVPALKRLCEIRGITITNHLGRQLAHIEVAYQWLFKDENKLLLEEKMTHGSVRFKFPYSIPFSH